MADGKLLIEIDDISEPPRTQAGSPPVPTYPMVPAGSIPTGSPAGSMLGGRAAPGGTGPTTTTVATPPGAAGTIPSAGPAIAPIGPRAAAGDDDDLPFAKDETDKEARIRREREEAKAARAEEKAARDQQRADMRATRAAEKAARDQQRAADMAARDEARKDTLWERAKSQVEQQKIRDAEKQDRAIRRQFEKEARETERLEKEREREKAKADALWRKTNWTSRQMQQVGYAGARIGRAGAAVAQNDFKPAGDALIDGAAGAISKLGVAGRGAAVGLEPLRAGSTEPSHNPGSASSTFPTPDPLRGSRGVPTFGWSAYATSPATAPLRSF